MKKDLSTQIAEVLNQYSICYSEKGILDNLDCYYRNKRGLTALLRKHPRWDESALAVILEVTATRDIDKDIILECQNKLIEMAKQMESISSNELDDLWFGLKSLLQRPAKLLVENDTLKSRLKERCDFAYVAGQKTSKAINKLCRQYKLNEHVEYDAVFAKLADALNPLSIPRKAVLSVHPCDYLQMSGANNCWSSCHKLSDGDFANGTLSYMNDPVSMIFYTVDPGNEDRALHDRPKITRTVFCYQSGVLLHSRLYPDNDKAEERKLNRRCVQGVFAECLKKPNLWRLDRSDNNKDKFIHTVGGNLHYPDYDADYGEMCFLKSNANPTSMVIGHNGYCVHCGKTLTHDEHKVVCQNCARLIRCADCGAIIEKSFGISIGGKYYCNACIVTCDQCNDQAAKINMFTVRPSSTEESNVCGQCRNQRYFQCSACGEYYSNADQQKHDNKVYCPVCALGFEHQEEVQSDNVFEMPEVLRRVG